MLNKPLNDVTDNTLREHLQHVQEEGQGKIIELTAVPTAAAPLLQASEWGVYSNVLYHRVGATILVFTPGSTISVT